MSDTSSSSSSSSSSSLLASSSSSSSKSNVQRPISPPSSSYSKNLTVNATTESTTVDHDQSSVCRVCRSDDPSLGPLFHPCRCTGSIAHVHQDCLSTWLSHSKKSSCELCGHLFSFEKVYKPGSPPRPPISTIIFQALKEILNLLLLLARATLVGVCWLGIVPWTVVWVSTAYWKAADWFAFGITSNPSESSSNVRSSLNTTPTTPITQSLSHRLFNQSDDRHNLFSYYYQRQNSSFFVWASSFLNTFDLDPNSIALDIFQGQLITCAIILSFVVVFLLREWILQNTPPPELIRDEEPQNIVAQAPANAPQPQLVEQLPLLEPPQPPQSPQVQKDDSTSVPLTRHHKSSSLSHISTAVDRHQATFSFQPTFSSSGPKDYLLDDKSLAAEQVSDPRDLTDRALTESYRVSNLNKSNYDHQSSLLHTVRVSSLYLFFVGDVSGKLSISASPESINDKVLKDPKHTKLLETWSSVLKTTVCHSSQDIPAQLKLFREFVMSSSRLDVDTKDLDLWCHLEQSWTRQLLSDSRIIQYLKSIYSNLDSGKLSRRLAITNALMYALVSILSLIERGESELGLDRLMENLEVLLFVPYNVDCEPLGQSLDEVIKRFSFIGEKKRDSVYHFRDEIVEILVTQNILGLLLKDRNFLEYIQAVTFDEHIFTDLPLKCLPLNSRFVDLAPIMFDYDRSEIDLENDLIEVTRHIITFKSLQQSKFQKSFGDHEAKKLDWIDQVNFEHEFLLTSIYIILCGKSIQGLSIPVLQNPRFKEIIGEVDAVDTEESHFYCNILRLWEKLARNCLLENCPESLKSFRAYAMKDFYDKNLGQANTSFDVDKPCYHFQKLEAEWLTKLLNDSFCCMTILSILSKRHKPKGGSDIAQENTSKYSFFLIKLIYVYLVLAADECLTPEGSLYQNIPAKIQVKNCRERFEFGFRMLDSSILQLEYDQPTIQTKGLKEVFRETRFLLKSCRPITSGPKREDDSGNDLGDLRYRLLSDRLKRGVIGVLVRQKVLCQVFTDPEFLQYANSVLFDPNLFSQSSILNDDLVEDIIAPVNRLAPLSFSVKGKGRADAVEEDQGSLDQSFIDVQLPIDALNSSVEDEEKLMRLSKTNHICDAATSASNSQSTNEKNHKLTQNADPSSLRTNSTVEVALGTSHTRTGTARPALHSGRQRALSLHAGFENPRAEDVRGVDLHLLRRGPLNGEEGNRAVPLGEQGDIPPPPLAPAPMAAPAGVGGDAFGFDEAGLNGGDDDLMAEDIDGILELIGMKGSLLMLAQNVGLMTMLLSLSLLAFVHLPHMIGKIAVLSRAHRILAPPLKGLLVLQRVVHRGLDYASDFLQPHLTRIEPDVTIQKFIAKVFPQKISGGFNHGSQSQRLWPVRNSWKMVEPLIQQTKKIISKAYDIQPVWNELYDRVGDRLNSIANGSKPVDRALAVLLGYLELVSLSFLYLSSGLDQQRARFVSETIVNGRKQQFLILKVGMFIFVELVIFPFLCGLLLNLTTIPIFPNATFSNRMELYGSSPYSSTLITWLAGTCFMFTFAILVSTCRESLRAGVCWWIRDPSDDRFNPIREILDRPVWSQVKKILASAVMYGTVIVFGLGSVVFSLIFFTGSLPLRIHPNRPISRSALDLVIYQTGLPLFLEWFQPRSKLKKSLQATSRFLARKLRLTCYLYGERRISEETKLEVAIYGPDDHYLQQKPVEQENRLSLNTVMSRSTSSTSFESNLKNEHGIHLASSNSKPKFTGRFTVSRSRKSGGGSFARVPASDSVKVVRGRKMHIPVKPDGTPIDPADMAIIEQQRAEAREEGGPEADHYTIVYLPPNFKLRMSLYVILMWTAAVFMGWQVIGVPLMVGRVIVDQIILSQQEEPHDVYAFGIGTLVCSILYVAGNKIYKIYSSWNETSEDEGSSLAENQDVTNLIGLIFRAVKKVFNVTVFLFSMGAVMPVLSSVIIDLYVLGPIKPMRSNTGFPVLKVLESWSYGCIYLSIGARLVRIVPNWILAAEDQVLACWSAGRVIEGIEKCNRLIIFPVTAGMIASIALPSIIFAPMIIWIPEKVMKRMVGWATISANNNTSGVTSEGSGIMNGLNPKVNEFTKVDCFYLILKTIYPMILSWYSHYLTTKVCFKGFSKWVEKVRDERFLEKRRLKK
ncbi:hypothetical protein PPACK8108_LOCUS9019 [Phakopsora pachyrhizi]|uniref:RING-type E3 ubiquitin transferase n=1 Tax=Phakopsora pachyrhizi TaxID=170000 RepID=A0AAV0AVR7_PHAPC|nr:hypothetical protein PPACK8108_LOCUS9019 [Phakopsora pachyrhizi]